MSSIVQIKDSAYDGLQSLRVYGNTVQNLWVNPSGTHNGVTVTSNEDGTITLSGTTTYAATVSTGKQYILKPSTKYVLSTDKPTGEGIWQVIEYRSDGSRIKQSGVEPNSTSYAFTTSPDIAYAVFVIYRGSAGVTLSGTYRVMLNEGSTAEPWCPPGLNSVGDGGNVKVVTAGKNLLERMGSELPYTFAGITFSDNGDGGIRVSGTATASVYYNFFDTDRQKAPFIQSGTYTASLTGMIAGVNLVVGYFDYGVGGRYSNWLSIVINEVTGSVDRPVYLRPFLSVVSGTTVDTVVYPQLELGSTATDYEPPNITTTPIDLQGHTLNALPDGTRDELHIDGGGNVVLEKRTGVTTAPTAAGSWTYDAPDSRAKFTLDDVTTELVNSDNGMCDKLPMRLKTQISNAPSYAIASGSYGYAKNPAITSTATAATVAGGATYIYPLAEPQTIDLGTIELPKLRKKPLVNTIWANGTAEGTGFSLAPEIDCEYNRWSTYCDGFKTHGKHSYFDMGCCIAARDTGTPEKKSVTATVPYMSGFYDLSKLYGAIAFEARQLMYRFEFVEDSREELQRRKSQFLEWLSQVHDEEIADDDIPGRHFIGSLSEWEFEEGEEGQSGSLEVTFNCQPFLEADEDTTKTCNAGSNTVTVKGQAVNVYAKTNSGTATIRIGGVTQSVGTTEIRLSVQLQPGDNAVTVTGSPVVLRWKELTV